jgi:3'-phosphoadenosine 5'-phosphosulfate sulfotransferase (PAPS reductase)/FAD synthetase
MDDNAHSLDDLRQYQALPLSVKILMSKNRIRKWVNEYGEDDVCVRMTLSPESLVLLHMVNEEYPNVKVAFSDDSELKPIVSWMASEDESGLDDWLTFGCNHFETDRPESRPLAFWTKDDVFEYLLNI